MKPVCLMIMDGWGVNERTEGNATKMAATPNLDALLKKYPSTTLSPSGECVGLPTGQMGNSEVGHLTIGAGRVVYQDLLRITKAAEDGSLSKNPKLKECFASVREGSSLHLMGLLSDGGVHSHIEHLHALLGAAKEAGLEKVFIHAFLDGRDTPPKSAEKFVHALEEKTRELQIGRVATISGRYYAMDRDNRWDRVELAYKAMTRGEGLSAASAEEAVTAAYARGESDEFVLPTVVCPEGVISDGDGVIFFNFRADRAREITRALALDDFDGFERPSRLVLSSFLCMSEFDSSFALPSLFSKERPVNILPEVLSARGIKQFRVSETEKYAHVTFFFNGGGDVPYPGEDRELIESVRDVPTYDLAPRMRAIEIAESAARAIEEGGYGFILLNLANGDMVGHTGSIEAAIEGCEAVDEAVGIVTKAASAGGWSVIVTSDHGNAEEMIDQETGEVVTAHSTKDVPFILVDDERRGLDLPRGGGLRDLAPTVLKIMEIPVPEEMDGSPLV